MLVYETSDIYEQAVQNAIVLFVARKVLHTSTMSTSKLIRKMDADQNCSYNIWAEIPVESYMDGYIKGRVPIEEVAPTDFMTLRLAYQQYRRNIANPDRALKEHFEASAVS